MSLRFSIVIPTLGNTASLRRLLASLRSVEAIDESEIILVKNPPDLTFANFVNEFSDLSIRFFSCEKGVNRARNVGLQKAKAPLILFLDDDCCVCDPELLVKHERAHAQNSWAFAVGGYYKNLSSSEICKAYSLIQKSWLQSTRLHPKGECRALLGGHFSIKSDLSPLLFDDSIVYGGSETEYFLRLHSLGYRFLLTDLSVVHEPQLNFLSFIKKAYRQGITHRKLKNFYGEMAILKNFSDSSKYQSLYDLFFHLRLELIIRKPLARIRRAIKNLHHDLVFYLSRQNLF